MPAKEAKPEHGLIAEAGKTIREYFCVFTSQVEEGIGEALPTGCNFDLLVVRWAAICYSRYVVGKDGRTAYEKTERKNLSIVGGAIRRKDLV